MADISVELAIISTATYGEQVRTALCDALRKINDGGGSSGGGCIAGVPLIMVAGAKSNVIAGTITEIESGE